MYVPEQEAVVACRSIARSTGLLLGGSSGSAIAAIARVANDICPEDSVIAICPDMGEKYLDTIYDDIWVSTHFPELKPIVTHDNEIHEEIRWGYAINTQLTDEENGLLRIYSQSAVSLAL